MASEAANVNWEVGRLGSETPVFMAAWPARTVRSLKFRRRTEFMPFAGQAEHRMNSVLRLRLVGSVGSWDNTSRRTARASHDATPYDRRSSAKAESPAAGGRHARRLAAADRGRRRHRQDGHARASRRLVDRPRRRSGPHPAADVHPAGGGRNAAPRGEHASPLAAGRGPVRRRPAASLRLGDFTSAAFGAGPFTPSPRDCSAATARPSGCRPVSRSTIGPMPRT